MGPQLKFLYFCLTIVLHLINSCKSDCSPGKVISPSCFADELKLVAGYDLLYRSCDCRPCSDKPFTACVGTSIPRPGELFKGCSNGKCEKCQKFTKSCEKGGQPCCDIFGKRLDNNNLEAKYNPFCDEATKTCTFCASTNDVCGSTTAVIPCCDKNIPCQKFSEKEFRCAKNICTEPYDGFFCPNISDKYKFCKCGGTGKSQTKTKGYSQCTEVKGYGNPKPECKSCVLFGEKCGDKDNCCQTNSNPYFNFNGTPGPACVNGTCQVCSEIGYGRPCKLDDSTVLPCCEERVYEPNYVCKGTTSASECTD